MRDIQHNYDDFMEFLADAMEPLARIAADPEVAAVFRENKPVVTLAKPLLKAHRDDMAEVLAALNGDTVEGFKAKFNAVEAVNAMLRMLSDPDMKTVFPYAEQMTGAASSGSASENTENRE